MFINMKELKCVHESAYSMDLPMFAFIRKKKGKLFTFPYNTNHRRGVFLWTVLTPVLLTAPPLCEILLHTFNSLISLDFQRLVNSL